MSNCVSVKKKREQFALLWAERYGIVDYTVRGCEMIYYKSYPKYLSNPPYSIKHIVNCDTGVEVSEPCSRVIRSGYNNV